MIYNMLIFLTVTDEEAFKNFEIYLTWYIWILKKIAKKNKVKHAYPSLKNYVHLVT